MAEQVIDYDILANKLKDILQPEPVAEDSDLADGTEVKGDEIIYTDPTAKICDDIEAKALNSLPMGMAVYRGKNGTQLVNHSQESLETVQNYRRNRRQYRTRSRL
mgnify:CR=1 FL=1|tara:strand:- start:611 stop:925 length:315 start_codon:yes stop_codon:yes gene_type:complete